MIEQIVHEEPAATPQRGEPVLFSRVLQNRATANCPEGDLRSWFDQIRMLDAEVIHMRF